MTRCKWTAWLWEWYNSHSVDYFTHCDGRGDTMSDIQLIVTDLDGTFFSGGYSIHPENLKAVQAARQAGIRVCACSGRLWGMGRHMVALGGF